VTHPRSTTSYLWPCVQIANKDITTRLYPLYFPLYFCIQSSLYISLLSTSIHSHTKHTSPFHFLALCTCTITQSIVEKENTAAVCPLTHPPLFPSIGMNEPGFQFTAQLHEKESICLWQNQRRIGYDLKMLFAQNREAVLQPVKHFTL
jgi:hypothetical protein